MYDKQRFKNNKCLNVSEFVFQNTYKDLVYKTSLETNFTVHSRTTNFTSQRKSWLLFAWNYNIKQNVRSCAATASNGASPENNNYIKYPHYVYCSSMLEPYNGWKVKKLK